MFGTRVNGMLFVSEAGRAVAYVPLSGTEFGHAVLLRLDDGTFTELEIGKPVGKPRMHYLHYDDPHRGTSGGFLHRYRDSVVIDGERFSLADEGFDLSSVTVLPLLAA